MVKDFNKKLTKILNEWIEPGVDHHLEHGINQYSYFELVGRIIDEHVPGIKQIIGNVNTNISARIGNFVDWLNELAESITGEHSELSATLGSIISSIKRYISKVDRLIDSDSRLKGLMPIFNEMIADLDKLALHFNKDAGEYEDDDEDEEECLEENEAEWISQKTKGQMIRIANKHPEHGIREGFNKIHSIAAYGPDYREAGVGLLLLLKYWNLDFREVYDTFVSYMIANPYNEPDDVNDDRRAPYNGIDASNFNVSEVVDDYYDTIRGSLRDIDIKPFDVK